jgi:hypothetical protein
MPDDKPGEDIKEQPPKQIQSVQAVNPPVPPDNPNTPDAKPISAQQVHAEVKIIEDRVKQAEKWMIGLTGAIAFFGLCQVVAGFLQWKAMSGQLTEMRGSSVDTHTLAEAARKQADKAETISDSIRQAVEALKVSNSQARQSLEKTLAQSKTALDTTITASHLDQRAWVGLTDFLSVNPLLSADGMKFSVEGVKLTIRNSGKTPAIHLSISVLETGRPFSDPIKDFDEINQENRFLIVQESTLPRGQALAPGVDLKYPLGGIFQPARDDQGRNITQYILVKITYNDIFTGTQQHTTKFCLMSLRPNLDYRPCPKGNSMD